MGPTASNGIGENTLRALIRANSIQSVVARGWHGGFAVEIRHGTAEHQLASARHDIRLFPNLTTLAIFLARLGITRFEVDVGNYTPGRVRKARPDRAAALRHTRTTPKQTSIFAGDA